MGTAAISDGDYVHTCLDHADVIIMVGHDVIEKPPVRVVAQSPQMPSAVLCTSVQAWNRSSSHLMLQHPAEARGCQILLQCV